jgi:hypothetical protein
MNAGVPSFSLSSFPGVKRVALDSPRCATKKGQHGRATVVPRSCHVRATFVPRSCHVRATFVPRLNSIGFTSHESLEILRVILQWNVQLGSQVKAETGNKSGRGNQCPGWQ